MYVHPAFAAPPSQGLDLLKERSFGLVIAHDGVRPHASHLPLLYKPSREGYGEVEFHVAKGNVLHKIVGDHPNVLIACQGPDSYLTPDWYASENQVPTWLYVTVHVSGAVRVLDPAEALRHVDELSAHFEAKLLPKKPWTSDKMEQKRRDAMLNAIVVMSMTVETVEPQWRLNQHKGDVDHASVVDNLRIAGSDAQRQIADLMDAARRR